MTTSQVLPSRLPESQLLQLAVAGYLARFKGISRTNAESDLRVGCQNSVTSFDLGVYATGACRTGGSANGGVYEFAIDTSPPLRVASASSELAQAV